MKLIIEIDKDLYESIAGKNSDQVEPRQVVRSFQATIADAIANGTPYNPSGDCISREYLQNLTCGIIDEEGNIHQVVLLADINNAPPVEKSKGEYVRGIVDALDKAFLLFDANSTYGGERVLQILDKLKWLEKLKAEKGGKEE